MKCSKSFKGMLVALTCCGVLAPRPTGASDGGASAASARAAVAQAAKAVDEARAKRALWTTAEDALRDAEAALAAGDYDAAVKAARFAAGQAQLGIQQLSYPRFPE